MKIVILSPAHPLRGGIAASSERLAHALQSAGHQVVIYSFALQYPSFLFPGKTQITTDPPTFDICIRTEINSISLTNWWRVAQKIAQLEQPDQIICRFWLPFMAPSLGTILRLVQWFSKKKIRRTALVDNLIPHEKRVGDAFLARFFVKSCDDFVVMSQSVGKEIQQFLGKSPNVIRFAPHPIYDNYGMTVEQNAARRYLQLPEGVPVVLFFGFIRAYKGLDLLLEAIGILRKRGLNIHLVVAGECYEKWENYQQIIDNQQISHLVHSRIDFIPSEEVRYYFSAADLVAQTYKTATQSGISQIAYHFEKPMLVTRVGGLPEIVEDGVSGYVVSPEPDAIAEKMADFFENQRADDMSIGVAMEKKRFSWEHMTHVLLSKDDKKD